MQAPLLLLRQAQDMVLYRQHIGYDFSAQRNKAFSVATAASTCAIIRYSAGLLLAQQPALLLRVAPDLAG